MIPSVLSSQVRQGIEDFLQTTFPITTPFFHGIIERLLNEDGAVFKGPYLSIQLPFRPGLVGKDYFPQVPLSFHPYLHQEQAFDRLSGESPRSTIVATGTGSGKTECFLYPLLDYCLRHRGEPGIKAIIIYPMNALATDQAMRLAKAIHGSEHLRSQVTAGLFVGEQEKLPHTSMGPEAIITDKGTLRLKPPDILLTNYKMLDYLLVRQRDYPLWQQNSGDTLRFIVVDEIHTFDGAQGTDLAALLRRLKVRIASPPGSLCCVGTSATLGSGEERTALKEYAEKVFGEPFDDNSIINESRVSAGEFLEKSLVSRVNVPSVSDADRLVPESFRDGYRGYTSGQHELWFEELIAPDAFDGNGWRLALVEKLKNHLFFQNLLKILGGKILTYQEIIDELQKVTPGLRGAPASYQTNLLNSLLALLSEARIPSGTDGNVSPFLHVRLQFWLRELRRLVGEVSANPRIRFADDLNDEQLKMHLPLVHCRECGSMGWAGTKRPSDTVVNPDLQSFYTAFFGNRPSVVFLFPADSDAGGQQPDGHPFQFCPVCLRFLALNARSCSFCGYDQPLKVFVPKNIVQHGAKQEGTHDCPYCGAANSLTIIGSQAASLTSVLVGQLYSSRFNDDKKLLTFSDSVQDAAHRAGFFEARTYRFTFRSALQKFVEEKGEGLALDDLPPAFRGHYEGLMKENEYVSTFLSPDMEWLADYDYLKREGHLPPGSTLPRFVENRIDWEIFSEYAFRARIGRTLEKTSSSVIHTDVYKLDDVSNLLLEVLQNEVGELRGLDDLTLRRFLVGLIARLKNEGALFHPDLAIFVEDLGSTFRHNRIPWMPNWGPRIRVPVFLTNRPNARFDVLLHPARRTWYQDWAEKCFTPITPLITPSVERLYQLVIEALVKGGIFGEKRARSNVVWGLQPDSMRIDTHVAQFRCDLCGHNVSVSAEELSYWDGCPCLRFHCRGHYTEQPPIIDYYGKLYASGDIQRIFAAEHTGLLTRDEREELEATFKAKEDVRNPWDPNLLSCTPTLELGIDIGDLSSVILCSVPPAQPNYIQRIGRAGRRYGNALNLTVANGRPHDLYFFDEPKEMIAGRIESPGVFLNASAVLERQFTAFCFDRWVESGIKAGAVPAKLGMVLGNLEPVDKQKFPHSFLLFLENHQTDLYRRFLVMFKGQLDKESEDHLRKFVEGDKDREGSLRSRIIYGLHGVGRERDSLRKKVRILRDKIKQKESDPVRNKNYEKELNELLREKTALQEIVKNIGDKDTFNFLTDEGLLPNYAFPQAGVILRSIIYRKREKKKDGESSYEHWVYEYERPAVSAISELAPANHFYAGGRKVRVDQVDMTVSEIQLWRLCNNCSHLSLIGKAEETTTCPKCGSTLWSDSGRKRQMLRMRQVFATTSDKMSRISDDSDDREPMFYNKQMLVGFGDADVMEAYRVDSDDVPFGFEFLSKATFREINFGEKVETAELVTIAGVNLPRKGFEVCRYCGKVQTSNSSPEHALSCSARDKQADKNLIDCVYLYREFSSEAIRILLPVTTFAGSEKKLHSFIAALQLGLKQKFSGRIDHLQTAVSDEPVPDSAYRKQYLVLYDTVPGGTGYLRQLMRSEAPLMDVFAAALESLTTCRCNQDPGKDGCYRCLFAYRNSYDMAETSRDTAIELLKQILAHRTLLIKTENLKNLSVNALFDSELEARFIEALRRVRVNDVPAVLNKELVNGKPGYFLKIGDRAYYIEPQVNLGAKNGVTVASKADFLFWPARLQEGKKPIAVYTDGYLYHRDRIGQDLIQRMAIAQSGKYRVWSLSWKDVENRFETQGNYFRNYLDPNPLQNRPTNGPNYGKFVDGYGLSALKDLYRLDSFELLVQYLRQPEEELWRKYAFVQCLMHIDAARFSSQEAYEGWWTRIREVVPNDLCEAVDEIAAPRLYGLFKPHTGLNGEPDLDFFVALEQAAVSLCKSSGLRVACVLDDALEHREKSGFEAIWNGFLRWYDLMQFLPGAYYVTNRGIEEIDYRNLQSTQSREGAAESDTSGDKWTEAFTLTDSGHYELLRFLQNKNCPAPEPGYELADRAGEIIATAELGWPEGKVAFLSEQEISLAPVFNEEGWQAFSLETMKGEMDMAAEIVKTVGGQ